MEANFPKTGFSKLKKNILILNLYESEKNIQNIPYITNFFMEYYKKKRSLEK